jgi:hypothetical protein
MDRSNKTRGGKQKQAFLCSIHKYPHFIFFAIQNVSLSFYKVLKTVN